MKTTKLNHITAKALLQSIQEHALKHNGNIGFLSEHCRIAGLNEHYIWALLLRNTGFIESNSRVHHTWLKGAKPITKKDCQLIIDEQIKIRKADLERINYRNLERVSNLSKLQKSELKKLLNTYNKAIADDVKAQVETARILYRYFVRKSNKGAHGQLIVKSYNIIFKS